MTQSTLKQPQSTKGRFSIDDIDYELVSKEAIEEMHRVILENDTTEFIPAHIKNVLFCGASKAGKSTIFNVLQNPCYCPKSISLFADTKFTCFKTFSLKDRNDGKVHNFVINLIDTPGTFEIRSSKEEFKQRGNDEIAGLITDCINHEITYLNLLVLVINATKFSNTEIDSVEIFLEMFGETAVPIVLCLTNADSIASKRRAEIEQELHDYAGLAQYFAKDLFKVQWMGCVNHVGKDYTDERIMFRDYKLVANWRRDFVDTIFQANKRVELDKTSIYENKKKSCITMIEHLLKELPKMMNIQLDAPTGQQQLSLINHRKDMEFLYKHSFYLEKEKIRKDEADTRLRELKEKPQLTEEEETEKSQVEAALAYSNNVLNNYSLFHKLVSDIKNSEMPTENKEILLSSWF